MKSLRIYIYIFSFISLLMLPASGIAQYYFIGQDPASVKWSQIETDNFVLIFPENYNEKAKEYLNLLEFSRPSVAQTYLEKTKKFKVVLHNRTTTSNAMVSPTPMHADFFEMPDQNTYAQLWSRQLTLHEYRHAIHIQKMKQGMTKGLYYVFGEQAQAAIIGLFIPFWFIEGDAVYSETLYSRSGRGRSPVFIMDLKAQIMDKKIYSYDKALYGSFKHYTPDYYTLGYQLVLKAYNDYGENIWNDALNKVARRPYTLMPFSSSIKKYFGNGKVGFYKNTLEELQSEYEKKAYLIKPENNFVDQPEHKHFTSYHFPVKVNDGNIIALKTGMDDINRFIRIDKNGKEKVLFTPGYNFNESMSANDSLICWNEKAYDPRWEMRNYSIIKLHNYKTSKTRLLSKKSRFFAPQLSNDATKVCAIEVNIENLSSVILLDVESGNIQQTIKGNDDMFLTLPRWTEDDKYIVCIAYGTKGKAIVKFDIASGDYTILMDWTFDDIKWASLYKDKLIYTAPYGETNNVYLKDLSNNNVYQLTNTAFDASNISFANDGKEIYYSEYTADGYKVSKVLALVDDTKLISRDKMKTDFKVDQLPYKSNFILDDSIVTNADHTASKYSKTKHLFNFHSWAPVGIDINNYTVSPGVSLMSQNMLSSSITTLGYYWDINEKTGKLKFNYDYYGLYPVINVGVEYGGRKVYQYNDSLELYDEVRFYETNLSLAMYLPLNFIRSKWTLGLQPYIGVNQQFLKMHKDSKYEFSTDRFTSMSYQISFYSRLKRSPKDIFSKWGHSMNLVYRHTPFGQKLNTQSFASLYLFLPGIVRHHGLRLYGAYQETDVINYPYAGIISLARGYANMSFSQVYSFKIDYALPIIYPDIAIPSVLYLKRIHGRTFYDYMRGLHQDWDNYSSTGIELYSDWHFLGLPAIFTLGGRMSYRLENSETVFEFLFGIGY